MKLFLTSTLLFLFFSNVFAQLNPISGLSIHHTYEYGSYCPGYNCFTLTWNQPEVSENDTLIGYNIYKDAELWRFQDDTSVGCHEYEPDCPDSDFVEPYAFWVKVKAVYNNTEYAESEAIDSVFWEGLALNIDQDKSSKSLVFPNPTNGIVKINSENLQKIIVINSSGKIVLTQIIGDEINLSNKPTGIYFVRILTTSEIITEKLVLE